MVKNGWDINLEFLDDKEFSSLLECSIIADPEILLDESQIDWIYELWDHFAKTQDLFYYKHLHLLIIQKGNILYLRKLNAEPKCLKYDCTKNFLQETANIFKSLGVIFLEDLFLKHEIPEHKK